MDEEPQHLITFVPDEDSDPLYCLKWSETTSNSMTNYKEGKFRKEVDAKFENIQVFKSWEFDDRRMNTECDIVEQAFMTNQRIKKGEE